MKTYNNVCFIRAKQKTIELHLLCVHDVIVILMIINIDEHLNLKQLSYQMSTSCNMCRQTQLMCCVNLQHFFVVI
jgi:hypothetical protein